MNNENNTAPAQLVEEPPEIFYEQMEGKLAVQKLRDVERVYRLLTENMSDIIWTTDINLRFTYISPSVTRLLGFSVAEALAMPVEKMLTPVSIRGALRACLAVLSRERIEPDLQRKLSLTLEHYHKDGSTVWLETEIVFRRDDDNRPIGILGISRDATRHMQAEAALERYAAILRLKSGEFDRAGKVLSQPLFEESLV